MQAITVKLDYVDPYGGDYIEHMAEFDVSFKEESKNNINDLDTAIQRIIKMDLDDDGSYGLIRLVHKFSDKGILIYCIYDYCNLCSTGRVYPNYNDIPEMIISYLKDKGIYKKIESISKIKVSKFFKELNDNEK